MFRFTQKRRKGSKIAIPRTTNRRLSMESLENRRAMTATLAGQVAEWGPMPVGPDATTRSVEAAYVAPAPGLQASSIGAQMVTTNAVASASSVWPPNVTIDGGATRATATALGTYNIYHYVKDTIGGPTNRDEWFKFRVEKPTLLTIGVIPSVGGARQVTMEVQGSTGTIVQRAHSGIDVRVFLVQGDYWVHLHCDDPRAGLTGFRLTAPRSFVDPGRSVASPFQIGVLSKNWTSGAAGGTAECYVGKYAPDDAYNFELKKSVNLGITFLLNGSQNPSTPYSNERAFDRNRGRIQLYSGNTLKWDSSWVTHDRAFTVAKLPAGKYSLRVTGEAGASFKYALLLRV